MIKAVYGRWTVLDGPYGQHREWRCRCSCGLEKNVRQQHLLSGGSKGCHTCRGEFGSRFSHVSKPIRDKLLHVVEHAIHRCTDKNNPKYKDYGGRGIRVQFADKASFIEYLLTLPGHDDFSLVIDRINNDGHYEVGNLRFTSHSISASNKRKPKSEKGYYGQHGFSRCFKRLLAKGVSLRSIGSLYCTNYGMILRCTK